MEDEPDFVGFMNNLTVIRGRDAVLSCSVSGWDDDEYTVRKNATFDRVAELPLKLRFKTVGLSLCFKCQ